MLPRLCSTTCSAKSVASSRLCLFSLLLHPIPDCVEWLQLTCSYAQVRVHCIHEVYFRCDRWIACCVHKATLQIVDPVPHRAYILCFSHRWSWFHASPSSIHSFYISWHQANVTVLKHGNVVSVARTPAGVGSSRITSLTMESGATLGSAATVYIDGTYEGDLMARAGVSYTWGREANSTYNESYAGRRDPWGVQAVRNSSDVLRDRCAPSHSRVRGRCGL